MNLKRLRVILPVIALAALTACGAETQSSSDSDDTKVKDPRDGWVLIDDTYHDGTWKACDGTTLVYTLDINNGGGIAVIPDSPECAK